MLDERSSRGPQIAFQDSVDEDQGLPAGTGTSGAAAGSIDYTPDSPESERFPPSEFELAFMQMSILFPIR